MKKVFFLYQIVENRKFTKCELIMNVKSLDCIEREEKIKKKLVSVKSLFLLSCDSGKTLHTFS
jgi:hypothetical protein